MKRVEEELGELLTAKGLTIATAESCTGGGIAALLTSIAGSSVYVKGGIVAYANEAKTNLLGVSEETLLQHGAVSRQTVEEMVRGAQRVLHADCAVATSGVAGPGGGTAEKPVGTVWMAAAIGEKVVTYKQEGDEGRAKNVEKAIKNVLTLLLDALK